MEVLTILGTILIVLVIVKSGSLGSFFTITKTGVETFENSQIATFVYVQEKTCIEMTNKWENLTGTEVPEGEYKTAMDVYELLMSKTKKPVQRNPRRIKK